MSRILKYIIFIILLFHYHIVFSQVSPDSTIIYRIETDDGNEFVGVIISQNSEYVTIQTEMLGEIAIPRKNIVTMEVIRSEQIVGGELWLENPQATRYFWAPNGYGVKRGEAYYQNVWVLFNQVVVGVSDNFSMGGGIVPLFLFAGAPTPVWITPKFSVPLKKDKLNLGGGALLGAVIGEEDATFGIFYGTTTIGSRDKNVSFGLGYGIAGGEWADVPTINVGFMLRTGRRGYIISENYYLDFGEPAVILSIGGRTIIRRAGIDYGAILPLVNDGEFIILPWLGLTIPLHK